MSNMSKKKIITMMALVIVIAILGTGTLAYFTTEKQVHNVITTGGVDIDVKEWQDVDGDGKADRPYPTDPLPAMPGTAISKIVTIENKQAEAFIRARFEIQVKDASGKVKPLTQEQLSRVITVTMPEGNSWQQKTGDSEWWYYNAPVKTGAATKPLFTNVNFDGPNMTNEYQNCTVEVIVKAQGVQTANNGASAIEAAGWPAEE